MAAGEVTEQAVEEVVRRIDGKVIGSCLIGVGVGVAVGFYLGYRYNKRKLRIEIFEEAEKEIDEMREHYRQKTIALEGQSKESIADLVQKKGYTPSTVTEVEQERPTRPSVPVEPDRPTRPPVPVDPPRPTQYHRELPSHIDPTKRVFRTEAAEKDKMDGWDYEREEEIRANRDTYIIHQDEYLLNESGYAQASYVYYSGDDVLVDEEDLQTILNNRERLIGDEALRSFGHGTDDYNLVHVRNSELELEFVINRVRDSWEEEVMGLENDEPE